MKFLNIEKKIKRNFTSKKKYTEQNIKKKQQKQIKNGEKLIKKKFKNKINKLLNANVVVNILLVTGIDI